MLAWLNLAVQPCLMAMEITPEPVVDSVHVAHTNHASHSPDHDCDHCPPASNDNAKSCMSAAGSDCGSIPDYNYDGRNGLSKLKDLPTFVAVAELAIAFEFVIPVSPSPPLDCAAVDHLNEPSLNIRFCVFLK